MLETKSMGLPSNNLLFCQTISLRGVLLNFPERHSYSCKLCIRQMLNLMRLYRITICRLQASWGAVVAAIENTIKTAVPQTAASVEVLAF